MAGEPADLYPSEQTLWAGSPTWVPVFDSIDRILIPLHVLWFGVFAVVFLPKPGPALFEELVLIFGGYLLVGRFVVRWLARRSSEYMITDLRLIVTSRSFGRSQTFTTYLRKLPPPVVREHRDGTGTIRFGSHGLMQQAVVASAGLLGADPQVPHRILQAQYVRDLIATAQERASRE